MTDISPEQMAKNIVVSLLDRQTPVGIMEYLGVQTKHFENWIEIESEVWKLIFKIKYELENS